MIRILLPLAVMAAAYFGPWVVDTTTGLFDGAFPPKAPVFGQDLIKASVDCLMDGKLISGQFGFGEGCRPEYGMLSTLVLATVEVSLVAAVIGILGLLPLIGRLTSLLTIAAGAVGVVTVAWFAKDVMGTDGADFADLQWGAWVTGAFSLLTLLAGLGGLGGDDD